MAMLGAVSTAHDQRGWRLRAPWPKRGSLAITVEVLVFAIELQAVSPHGQRRRAYETHVGSDLFGQLVVTINFGIIGARDQRWVNVIKLEGIKVFIERCRKADKVVSS
jgi:hypothetical protein